MCCSVMCVVEPQVLYSLLVLANVASEGRILEEEEAIRVMNI